MQGVQRYVIFAYLVTGLILWVTLARLFGSLAFATGVPDPAILGNSFTLGTLIAMIIAVAGGAYAYGNDRIREFCFDVALELRKVTWPSRRETQTATVVVIIATVLCALLLGMFDFFWAQLTGLIYSSS